MKNYLFIAVLFLFSCKRDVVQKPPVGNPTKIAVKLKLSGDISTSVENLRSIYDSAVYAVKIVTADDSALYAQGLFDKPDSIRIDLLKDSSYIVTVAVIKRGSSYGLWWTATYDGGRIYDTPLSGKLSNKILYAADTLLAAGFLDSLSNMRVLTDSVISFSARFPYGEVDSYIASTNYTARDENNTTINLLMRRLSFAVRYDIHNLNAGGSLIASYGGKMKPDTFTSARANDTLPRQIYTAYLFRKQDESITADINVSLTWVKPGGATVALGTKALKPKRNTLTNISVFLSTAGGTKYPGFQLNDTVWNETIDYALPH